MAGEAYRVRVRPPGGDLWIERSDLEVRSISISLNEPRTLELFHGGRHDQIIGLDINWQVQVSPDPLFRTLVFNGLVQTIAPGGLANEGITITCVGIEWILQRMTLRWNSKREWTYNPGGYSDMRSEAFGTDVDPQNGVLNEITGASGRWYLSDIIADILEHAFGVPYAISEDAAYSDIQTSIQPKIPILFSPYHRGRISTLTRPLRSGGVGTPYHHPNEASVTNMPMRSLYAPVLRDSILTYGAVFGWIWSEIYDMHYPAQEVRLSGTDSVWDALQSIVSMTGTHAMYVDHSIPNVPTIRFVNLTSWKDFVDLPINLYGVHASSPSYSLLDETFEMDSSRVKNRVVVALNGMVTTGPGPLVPDTTMTRRIPPIGSTDDWISSMRIYTFNNLHDLDVVMGGNVTAPSDLSVVLDGVNQGPFRDRSDWGPRISTGGLEDFILDFVPEQAGAIVRLDYGTLAPPDTFQVSSLFRRTVELAVGPDPRTNKYFPRPGPFDAWAQWSLCSEVVIEDPSYVAAGVPDVPEAALVAPIAYSLWLTAIRTRKSVYQVGDTTTEYLAWASNRFQTAELGDLLPKFWDYFDAVYAAACQMQRRFRDVSVSIRVVRDLVKSVRQHTELGPYWDRPRDPLLPEVEIADFVRLVGAGIPIVNLAVLKVSSIRVDYQNGTVEISATSDLASQGLSFEDMYLRKLHELRVRRELALSARMRGQDSALGRGELPAGRLDPADAMMRPDMILPVLGPGIGNQVKGEADKGAGDADPELAPVVPNEEEATPAALGVKTNPSDTAILQPLARGTQTGKIKAMSVPLVIRDKAGNNYLVNPGNVSLAAVKEPLHHIQRGLYKLSLPRSFVPKKDASEGLSGILQGDEIEALNLIEARTSGPAGDGYVGALDVGDIVLVISYNGAHYMLEQPRGIGRSGALG